MRVTLSKAGKKSSVKMEKWADVWPFDITRVSICSSKDGQIGITIADDRFENNIVLEILNPLDGEESGG